MHSSKKKLRERQHPGSQRAGRIATAVAVAGPRTAAVAVGPTTPTTVEQLLLECTYAPGCFHSLRKDERMSPEINEIIPVFQKFVLEFDNFNNHSFWEQPENAPFANERMVRFFFYRSVKFILGKDTSVLGQDGYSLHDSMMME